MKITRHHRKPSRRFELNLEDGKVVALHAAFIFACAAPWIAIGLIWHEMSPASTAAATALSSTVAKLLFQYCTGNKTQ